MSSEDASTRIIAIGVTNDIKIYIIIGHNGYLNL